MCQKQKIKVHRPLADCLMPESSTQQLSFQESHIGISSTDLELEHYRNSSNRGKVLISSVHMNGYA